MSQDKRSVVVIMGAGASAVLGLPLQSQLWQALKTRYEGSATAKEFLKQWSLLYGDRDIETSFTIAELAALNGGLTLVCEDVPKAEIICLQGMLRRLFIEFAPLPEGLPLYRSLLKLLYKRYEEVTFISLNWDTTLEKMLLEMGRNYNYGLLFDNNEMTSERYSLVLKPHGSVNWLFCRACKRLTISDQEKCACGSTAEPVLTPPSFRKDTLFQPLNSLGRKTYQKLAAADTILVVGYSFREADYDMRYLLASALSASFTSQYTGKEKRVVVADNAATARRIREFVSVWEVKVQNTGRINPRGLTRLKKIL